MPPAQDAACVAGMAAVRATDAAAYDPQPPVRWMDAQPGQVRTETRVPIAATPQQGPRGDDADARHGPASIVLVAEPRSGCRPAPARHRRTKGDWAREVAQL